MLPNEFLSIRAPSNAQSTPRRRFEMGLFALLVSFTSNGCGYTLKTQLSPMFRKENIHTLYLQPLENESTKPSAENVVYGALLRRLGSIKDLRMVTSPEAADAILRGKVTLAGVSADGSVPATSIAGKPAEGAAPGDTLVATLYRARLTVGLSLLRRQEKVVLSPATAQSRPRAQIETQENLMWATTLDRDKQFNANTRLGILGSTSHLINESELDRALSDLAELIASDAEEALVSQF